jgi:hypothetical protein
MRVQHPSLRPDSGSNTMIMGLQLVEREEGRDKSYSPGNGGVF